MVGGISLIWAIPIYLHQSLKGLFWLQRAERDSGSLMLD